MKKIYPTKRGFAISVSRIPTKDAQDGYDYALWEAGFECAIRKMQKLIKFQKPILSDCDIEPGHTHKQSNQ